MLEPNRRTLLSAALLVLSLLIASLVLAMDQDGDTDTDVDDIDIILAALNTPASGATDPRDLDSDGTITILDARLAVLDCTRPLCVTGNNPPTITGPGNQTILEDGTTGALAVTVGDPDIGADPNTLVLSATSSDQALIPNGNLTVGGTGTARTVTATPVANASGGPVTITLVVDDGAAADNTAMTTFDVTVTPVNDAPTINAISDPAAIPADSPQQSVNMSGISAGPNESQTISITATSSNTGLIPNPSVTYTSPNTSGFLQYTPVAGQSGTAVVTVTVMDNGGTANGGVDTTVETFTVEVTAVVSTVSFANDVYPLFSACTACHGASATSCSSFGGQNLSGNVASVYAELVTEASCTTTASGNRTDTTTPADSLILLKPTASVAHGGGQRAGWSVDNCAATPNSNYCLTLRWIQAGVPNN